MPVQIPDVLTDPEYALRDPQRRAGYRALSGRPASARRCSEWCDHLEAPYSTAFQREADRARHDLRRPGSDRYRKRTFVRRSTGAHARLARSVEELEIASQHKSQFVANMSHELRTPLAAMLGYAELIQEGIYGRTAGEIPADPHAHPFQRQALAGPDQYRPRHLQDRSRPVQLNLGEYALGNIVETVMVATESLAATKKLAFKMDVAKGLPYGLGDEQRLTQVLLNLVGNAIKFTDAGEVRIAAGAANGHFELSVSDTGPGIPPEEARSIFEKFQQVDSSNTRPRAARGSVSP